MSPLEIPHRTNPRCAIPSIDSTGGAGALPYSDDRMSNRREVITLIGGAAAWPLTARAQQGSRVRRIGVLIPATADDADYQARVGAFLQGLQQLGWTIGQNVRIDTRWATSLDFHGAELT